MRARVSRAAPAALALAWLCGGEAIAASFPPQLRFRSLSTGQVTVHFHEGLEQRAGLVAALATELLQRHEARYRVRVGRVHVVFSDVDDGPNGFATPLPYPLVSIRAAAPDGTDGFGNYGDWLRLVLSHELAHLAHLEHAHGLLGAGRKLFGRAPFLFPNAATPTWLIEGLATYEETEATGFGRGRDPDSRMIVRMAALEGDFPAEDRPVLGLDRWPGGVAAYVFGEAFVRDLQERFGPQTIPEVARVHAGRVIPFFDELTGRRVTGATFRTRWGEWAEATGESSRSFARSLDALGLTASQALTRRGVRQTGPRFSPDGRWIAYTSRSLSRYPEIRLIRPDGSEDHRVLHRNGGAALAWTPDGRAIVFDEPEVYRRFSVYSDLRVVDLATGQVTALTTGQRARDPDVAPDGSRVVFVGRLGDVSELFTVGLDGTHLRRLTQSEAGVQWSGPRWSPGGEALVAARWEPGGWLDVVRVEVATGRFERLTWDRAKDVEPDWLPDGRQVVFRSDRDGVSNLYLLRLEDGALRRVTRVLGGAFTPAVSPDGQHLAFAAYSARGYDIHLLPLDEDRLEPAPFFVDPLPVSPPPVEATAAQDRPYRPLPAMLPRFWSPYAGSLSGEWRYGIATGGVDPLFRHAYGLAADRAAQEPRLGFRGFYRYDRFLPTLLLTGGRRVETDAEGEPVERRDATARVSVPLRSSFRRSQSLSLAWRRERELPEAGPGPTDRGGLELGWTMNGSQRYPLSISPVDGWLLQVSCLKEDPAFGSDVSLGKLVAEARGYLRLSQGSQVLAVQAGGGTTLGRPGFRRSFSIGGFASGDLFDIVDANQALLRGYPNDAFSGRSFAHLNAEYRFPLGHPQRGLWTIPFFFRHVHGAVFADAAHVWSGGFRLDEVRTGAGVSAGTDMYVGHGLPLTVTASLAHGLGGAGETRFYFRAGLAF